jgi:hypothetical protein
LSRETPSATRAEVISCKVEGLVSIIIASKKKRKKKKKPSILLVDEKKGHAALYFQHDEVQLCSGISTG